MALKIMCLNGWGGKLHDAGQPCIETAAPDILCPPEGVHSPAFDKDWLSDRGGDHILPQRTNVFRAVCHALPDHVTIFCPRAQGVLWDNEQTVPSQWGLATFVHRAFPIIGQVQGFVHKDCSLDGYGEHPDPAPPLGSRL